MQAVLHGASLCLENVVEIFSGAVVSIADNVAPVDSATMALQLVRKISEKGLLGGAAVFEVLSIPS